MSPMALPPLVDPIAELPREQTVRYARHLSLAEFGEQAQRRLANARVLVIGAGGLGAPTLLYLAAAGVGTLGVIDDDLVDESNLQRQVIHGMSDLGRPKVESARDAVAEVNPYVRTELHPYRLDRSNAVELFSGYDLVLDGTDNFATRYLVADACELADKPYVWGSILRFTGQASVFWASHGPTYRDLFPEPPAPGTVPSCAEGGVLGVLPGAIGTIMATEAIKLITGIGEPLLGRLLVHDALAMTHQVLDLSPDPHRVPVTELVDHEQMCGVAPATSTDPSTDTTQEETMESEITATQLKSWLTEREAGQRNFVLVDVREPFERDINAIDGSVSIPMGQFANGEALGQLDELTDGGEVPVVLYCKVGGRSGRCLEFLHAQGRTDAVHVGGGVDAWIDEVEPHQTRY